MLFGERGPNHLIVAFSMLVVFMAPFQSCHNEQLQFLPKFDPTCTHIVLLFMCDSLHVRDHLDDALELQELDQVGVWLHHEVDRHFVKNLLLVGRVRAIGDIEELKFVGPLEIVVDRILAISEQLVDSLAVLVHYSGKVEVDDVAKSGVLGPVSATLELSDDVLVPLYEFVDWHIVYHHEGEYLLQD